MKIILSNNNISMKIKLGSLILNKIFLGLSNFYLYIIVYDIMLAEEYIRQAKYFKFFSATSR